MVDLGGLHARLRPELDRAVDVVLQESAFIRGKHVDAFEAKLTRALHLDGHVVGCGNGTDALALALRALGEHNRVGQKHRIRRGLCECRELSQNLRDSSAVLILQRQALHIILALMNPLMLQDAGSEED